ncbi:hypothetical protein Pelo_5436 [Pelomyxa schiedti]|nr:hypothetical protein Pelo_5436 [Pelomyxa schiedti]
MRIYLCGVSDRPILLYAHGNGEDIGHCGPQLRNWGRALGCNTAVVEYIGYGLCAAFGTASEGGCKRSIDAAMFFLINELHIPASQIFVSFFDDAPPAGRAYYYAAASAGAERGHAAKQTVARRVVADTAACMVAAATGTTVECGGTVVVHLMVDSGDDDDGGGGGWRGAAPTQEPCRCFFDVITV